MPKRARSGEVSSPVRVVAPISVNGWIGSLTDRAPGPLADHDVELVVLHRRIEDLLDGRAHAVHFVDEEHLARLEVGQHRRQVARLLDDRPGGGPDRDAQLVARSRRPASSCRDRADRRAARDRAPRRAAWPRRSTRADSRGRGPGRCTRRAFAGAGPPRTGRPRPRARR